MHHVGRADAGQVGNDPNALIPGNKIGVIFGGVADPAIRAKIIAFLKQDTHASPPASNSTSQPPPAKQ
jgi:hypothetical protein